MAGKGNGKASDLDDPSLLDDEPAPGEERGKVDDVIDNTERELAAPADSDIEVVVEEETEADLDARERRDDAGREDAGRQDDEETREAKDGERGREDTQYGKEVRARIAREARIARDANARADAAVRRAVVAEAASRKAQKEALEVTEGALESTAKSTRAQLLKAKEDGKSEDEIKLQEDLDRINRRKEAVVAAKQDIDRQEDEAKRGGTADATPSPHAQQWLGRNKWFTDPRFAEQVALTRVIDRTLKGSGWDPNTPEYFDELERRIRRRMPEMQRFLEPAKRQAPKREATGGAPRADRVVQRTQDGKRKVTLNKADLETMTQFGLDPKNKEHLREFAENKISGGR